MAAGRAVITASVEVAAAAEAARPLRRNLPSILEGTGLRLQRRRAGQVAATKQHLAPSVSSSEPSALAGELHTRVSSPPPAF